MIEDELLALLRRYRLVAVMRLPESSRAVALSRTLLAGGIALQEFTLTNPGALEAIEQTRKAIDAFNTPTCKLGVGSVLKASQVVSAAAAGAQFVVTPVFSAEVVEACKENGLPCLCGAMTPTEIWTASQAGAAAVKVFPARQLGAGYIRDVLAPLPSLNLVPTGGICRTNIRDYLVAGALAVGVGGELVDRKLVAAGEWDQIERTAATYVSLIAEFGAGK